MSNNEPKGVTLPVALVAAAFMKAAERDWRGDCYLASLEFFADAARIMGADVVRLVHGTPVLRGDRNGERIGHGWVEVTTPDAGMIVFDLTNGPGAILGTRFYEVGHLNHPDAVVIRYTKDEILARIEAQMADSPDEEMFMVGPWDERVSAAAHTNAEGQVERKARTA